MTRVSINFCIALFFIASTANCQGKFINGKSRTYRGTDIKFNYPKNWKKFGGIGFVYLKPKEIFKQGVEDGNYLLTNKTFLEIREKTNLTRFIENYARILKRNEVEKSFNIIDLGGNSYFNYKVTYIIKYSFSDLTFKKEEYFKSLGERLNIVTFQMQEDYFTKYYEEALFIIESIKYKKPSN